MIRIELDRVHLELLVLGSLFATFAGVVFPPVKRSGLNMTPLVAFLGIGILGIGVLVHRRIFTDSTDTRSRMRATVWFAVVGAVLGAAVSTIVDGPLRSMVIASAGGALMFAALGTQFGIVVNSREEAARDAVETILDEQNVFVTPEDLWPDDATEVHENNGSSDSDDVSEPDAEPETDESSRNEESETDDSDENDEATEADESDESTSDEQIDDDIERIDVSASSDWKQSTADDNIPIPVIKSVESGEYSEE